MQARIACALGLLFVSLATSCHSSTSDDKRTSQVRHDAVSGARGPSMTPLKDGAQFTSRITHPYFPLSTVHYAELRSDDEFVVREVLPDTRTIAGVDCTVLAEKEHEGDAVKEISYNFFAQDTLGNVYYFGEEVDEYKDGKVSGHGGAWLVGKNATEPCVFMPAQLTVGLGFKNENSPPAAEEWNEIVDRLWLKHRGVQPGLDRLRLTAGDRFLRRNAADRRRIDGVPVSRSGARPAAAGAFGRPRRHRVVRVGRTVIREETFARRHCRRARVRLEKSGCEDLAGRFTGRRRGGHRAANRRGPRFRIEIGGALDVGIDALIRLRAELRHQLGIFRRQPCELHRQIDRALQRRIVDHVRGR